MSNYNIPKLFKATEPVFIVGGGSSLKDFNWSLLEGKQCVAVNTAFKKVKHAQMMFFCDHYFVKQHGDVNGEHFWRFQGDLKLTVWNQYEGCGGIKAVKVKNVPFSEEPDFLPDLQGKLFNAGALAVNAAYLAGARHIVLLGFDMCKTKDGNNWHTGTKLAHNRTTDGKVYDSYIKAFDSMAEYIKENKIKCKIVNCSKKSKLKCFPKKDLTEYLKA